MKKMILAAALSICAFTAKAGEDFKRVVQVVVTDTSNIKMEAVSIEVDGKTIYTDFNGMAYLDVPPGRYVAKVSRIACGISEFEIEVTEKTGFISLRLNCD